MLLAALISLISYSFPLGSRASFHVKVDFEGYLPILRGRQALADLDMQVDVTGGAPAPDANAVITSEIKSLKLTLNSAVLPFGPESIAHFFPKTTIEATPFGHLVKTNAPNVTLPVHLPGLDVKRFPDITYLPLEFPESGIEEGKAFQFEKPFGDGPVQYEVTPVTIGQDTVDFTIKISQTTVTYEDARRVPTDAAHAATRIDTQINGTGTAKFDLKSRLVTQLDLEAQSVGQAVDLTTKKETDRKLKTTLHVELVRP